MKENMKETILSKANAFIFSMVSFYFLFFFLIEVMFLIEYCWQKTPNKQPKKGKPQQNHVVIKETTRAVKHWHPDLQFYYPAYNRETNII